MTNQAIDPTFTFVKERLAYDPETGIFTWKVRPRNRTPIGTVAGGVRSSDGYARIQVAKGLRVPAHRLAWLLTHGVWPEHEIDHINGVRDDNRLCNLRSATPEQNQANQGIRKNNASGFKGVSFHEKGNKYQAHIGIKGKSTYLGLFATAELASEFYQLVADMLRGEFARHA